MCTDFMIEIMRDNTLDELKGAFQRDDSKVAVIANLTHFTTEEIEDFKLFIHQINHVVTIIDYYAILNWDKISMKDKIATFKDVTIGINSNECDLNLNYQDSQIEFDPLKLFLLRESKNFKLFGVLNTTHLRFNDDLTSKVLYFEIKDSFTHLKIMKSILKQRFTNSFIFKIDDSIFKKLNSINELEFYSLEMGANFYFIHNLDNVQINNLNITFGPLRLGGLQGIYYNFNENGLNSNLLIDYDTNEIFKNIPFSTRHFTLKPPIEMDPGRSEIILIFANELNDGLIFMDHALKMNYHPILISKSNVPNTLIYKFIKIDNLICYYTDSDLMVEYNHQILSINDYKIFFGKNINRNDCDLLVDVNDDSEMGVENHETLTLDFLGFKLSINTPHRIAINDGQNIELLQDIQSFIIKDELKEIEMDMNFKSKFIYLHYRDLSLILKSIEIILLNRNFTLITPYTPNAQIEYYKELYPSYIGVFGGTKKFIIISSNLNTLTATTFFISELNLLITSDVVLDSSKISNFENLMVYTLDKNVHFNSIKAFNPEIEISLNTSFNMMGLEISKRVPPSISHEREVEWELWNGNCGMFYGDFKYILQALSKYPENLFIYKYGPLKITIEGFMKVDGFVYLNNTKVFEDLKFSRNLISNPSMVLPGNFINSTGKDGRCYRMIKVENLKDDRIKIIPTFDMDQEMINHLLTFSEIIIVNFKRYRKGVKGYKIGNYLVECHNSTINEPFITISHSTVIIQEQFSNVFVELYFNGNLPKEESILMYESEYGSLEYKISERYEYKILINGKPKRIMIPSQQTFRVKYPVIIVEDERNAIEYTLDSFDGKFLAYISTSRERLIDILNNRIESIDSIITFKNRQSGPIGTLRMVDKNLFLLSTKNCKTIPFKDDEEIVVWYKRFESCSLVIPETKGNHVFLDPIHSHLIKLTKSPYYNDFATPSTNTILFKKKDFFRGNFSFSFHHF